MNGLGVQRGGGGAPGLQEGATAQPGAGVEGGRKGGALGSAVESVGLRRTAVQICGSDEQGQRRHAAARDRDAGGGSCVVPPTASRLPARDSLQSEILVFSACGNVVWRKVAPRPRALLLLPLSSPTSRTLPLPAPRLRPLPPPFSDRARCRSPVAGANLEQPGGPLGRNLGRSGVEGASHSRSWSPGAGQGVWIPGGRGKSWPGLESRPRVQGREPAAVSGGRIAAWLEAKNALGDCLQC